MTRRRVRPDELELWQKINRDTERLHPAKPALPDPLSKPVRKPTPPASEPTPIAPFTLGEKARKLGEHAASRALDPRPARMDRKAFQKLRRGKMQPESRIDLHGMTLDQAHPALTAFSFSAYARGERLVLVITGKGQSTRDDGPIPQARGVLRRHVPHWLETPPVSQVVLEVTNSNQRHGGSGAYYVYLRRRR